jgi:Ion channel
MPSRYNDQQRVAFYAMMGDLQKLASQLHLRITDFVLLAEVAAGDTEGRPWDSTSLALHLAKRSSASHLRRGRKVTSLTASPLNGRPIMASPHVEQRVRGQSFFSKVSGTLEARWQTKMELPMLVQFSAAAGLTAATIAIQGFFMSMGLRTFRWCEEHRPMAMARRPTLATVIWILFLMIPVIFAVTLWAIFYYLQDALPSFEQSLYFSTVTFTTVGYGDIVLGNEWRQLATFEAMNGWIIFGWATALIMAVVQRLYLRVDAR